MLNVLWMRLLQRGLVEIPLVKPSGINVEGFFVNFGGVQTRRQDQRSVHLTAPVGR